jgi:transmembrane sensor
MKNENMNNLEKEEAINLIVKYLGENATSEEIAELERWIAASPVNWTYFMQQKNIWHSVDKSINPADISTKRALDSFLKQISKETTIIYLWKYFQKVAAILILPLIIGGFLWQNGVFAPKSVVAFKEVFTSTGTRMAFSLDDGTKVWLNAGSSLRYPEKFTTSQRNVFLQGEAYFEVKSDKTRPFYVNTQSISVKATGTKFNVRTYLNKQESAVSLLEGKVSVFKAGAKDKDMISDLKPNQHLEYNTISEQAAIVEGDQYKYVAWREGKLIFRNDPLSDVLEKIGEFNNVHFQFKDTKLLDYRFHITFKNESLPEILDILKATSPMDFKILKRRADLPDGSIPKQEIIIFQKHK